MACSHLVKGRFGHCIAGGGMFIPSIYERTQYCEAAELYKACPLYAAHAESTLIPFDARREEQWLPAGYPAPTTQPVSQAAESRIALPVWPDRFGR